MKKRLLLLISFCIAVILTTSACNVVKIPLPDEFIESTSYEDWVDLAGTADEKALVKAWGEPERVGSLCLWPIALDGGVRYITATVEDGDVISVSPSFPLFVIVAEKSDHAVYCFVDPHDHVIDSGKVAFMPAQDIFGNAIECETGDVFYFEFDGMIMESYPCKLNAPYSAVKMGKASDEELDLIAKEMKKVHSTIDN